MQHNYLRKQTGLYKIMQEFYGWLNFEMLGFNKKRLEKV